MQFYFRCSLKTIDGESSLTLPMNVDEADSQGRSTLSWAAQNGDCKVMKQLISLGAIVNRGDHEGLTPLHYSIFFNKTSGLQLLLRANAKVTQTTTTALMLASRCGLIAHVRALLDYGVEVI